MSPQKQQQPHAPAHREQEVIPNNTLDVSSAPYAVRLRSDVKTQIGLFNGILGYQSLYGESPFDSVNNMTHFFNGWLEVDEPFEPIVSVIEYLRTMRFRDAVAVENDDLEREAFSLAQKIWDSGSDKSVNVANSSAGATSSNNLMSPQILEKEKAGGSGEGVVPFNGMGDKSKVEENSSKPMHHDSILEYYLEQLKSAGIIGNLHGISAEERKIMDLADELWSVEMQIPDASPGNDHNRDAKIARIWEKCNQLLTSLRVAYENAKAAGLLKAHDNSIPASEEGNSRTSGSRMGEQSDH